MKLKNILKKEYRLECNIDGIKYNTTGETIKDAQLIMELGNPDWRHFPWKLYKKGRFYLPERIIDFKN